MSSDFHEQPLSSADEQLLAAFFKPSAEMEVADGGFTDSVMDALPAADVKQKATESVRRAPQFDATRFTRWWNAAAVAVFAAVFVVLDGWQLTVAHAARLADALPTLTVGTLTATALSVLGGLTLVAVSEAVSRA